jgi:hypothetical protein
LFTHAVFLIIAAAFNVKSAYFYFDLGQGDLLPLNIFCFSDRAVVFSPQN